MIHFAPTALEALEESFYKHLAPNGANRGQNSHDEKQAACLADPDSRTWKYKYLSHRVA